MEDVGAIATYFVAFMVATEVYRVVQRRGRGYLATLALVRGLRGRHFRQALLVLVATLISAALLMSVLAPFPWATTGWWNLLGGQGNLIWGSTDAARAGGASPVLRAIPYVIPFALLVIIPTLARVEERIFRRGTQRRSRGRQLLRQLVFGLMHMLAGVPLAIGLALAVTGCMYLRIYHRRRRGTGSQGLAVLESTRAHIAANTMVVAIVVAGLAFGLAAG